MKKILLLLLLGAVLGTTGWQFYQSRFPPSGTAQRTGDLAGRLGDAGIVALIKGKYLVDRDLSSLAIGVDCAHGRVTLTGSAASPELIVRATQIARQTKGVTDVTSLLTVKNGRAD